MARSKGFVIAEATPPAIAELRGRDRRAGGVRCDDREGVDI